MSKYYPSGQKDASYIMQSKRRRRITRLSVLSPAKGCYKQDATRYYMNVHEIREKVKERKGEKEKEIYHN